MTLIERPMTEDQIKYMVSRFLSWRLPENFNPDGGVNFRPQGHEPSGTNLLDATQAEAMVRYLIESLPDGNAFAQYATPAPRAGTADFEGINVLLFSGESLVQAIRHCIENDLGDDWAINGINALLKNAKSVERRAVISWHRKEAARFEKEANEIRPDDGESIRIASTLGDEHLRCAHIIETEIFCALRTPGEATADGE